MDPEENVKGRMAVFLLGEYLIENVHSHEVRTEILRLFELAVSEYITYTADTIGSKIIDAIKEEKI